MVHEIIEVNKFGELTRHTCTDLDVLKKVEDKSFQFRDLGLLHIDGESSIYEATSLHFDSDDRPRD